MPENEPENILKIQLPFRNSLRVLPLRSSRSLRLILSIPSAISTIPTKTFVHFNNLKPAPQKPPPFNCSVLFRFVPPEIFRTQLFLETSDQTAANPFNHQKPSAA